MQNLGALRRAEAAGVYARGEPGGRLTCVALAPEAFLHNPSTEMPRRGAEAFLHNPSTEMPSLLAQRAIGVGELQSKAT